jgi:hypothetical protein
MKTVTLTLLMSLWIGSFLQTSIWGERSLPSNGLAQAKASAKGSIKVKACSFRKISQLETPDSQNWE